MWKKKTFLASSQSLPPFFFQDPESSLLSLFWILFLEDCLSPPHLVFLGFYLVPSSGTWLSAFSCWLTFCSMVLALVVAGLWFFLLLLSALWWRRLRVLCKLPDGRDRWWEKLGLALVGRALLSKALTQLFADVWGTFLGSFLAWGHRGLGSMDSMVGLMANSKSGLCQRGPSQTAAVSPPIPVVSPCQPTPPQETLEGSPTLEGSFGSVSCGVTALFLWVLVHARLCLCPPRLESLFPLVLWKSCDQIPLAFKTRFPGQKDSQSFVGSPDWEA